MLTTERTRSEENNIGKNPTLSPTEIPITTFSIRVRYIVMSSNKEKIIVKKVNTSSGYLDLSALPPRT
jgi:hypothetical protein